ncbi:MAG: type IV pilus twitching motility protein PilT [Gammaproteobacteria bacterium]|nr:type IV pilus twitching motility protein PilT [Gammaproteobacteria bacterium]
MVLLENILRLGVQKNASDIHLSAGLSPLLRVHGDLVHMNEFSELHHHQIIEMIKSTQQIDLDAALEADFSLYVPDLARFRVNVFRQANGMAAVFRVIPEHIPTLDELKLPQKMKSLLSLSNGLILVTGPTGSGKSTTLAAMVQEINQHNACHIITIEDPIEFIHHSKRALINQRQVHRDTQDYATALRSALREDPDVILIGEMRDLETIRLALTAAETGHLVLATLHTASAARTVNRIIDVFPAGEKNMIRNMLAESLQAVICQTLLPSLNAGRVAAFEIMLGTSAIRNLIREDKVAQIYSAIQTGSVHGMCTLDQSLSELVSQQLISPEAANQFSANRDLARQVKMTV